MPMNVRSSGEKWHGEHNQEPPIVDAGHAEKLLLAEAVRQACLQVALASYQDALMNGLCHEGAWECALGAMRTLDVGAIIEK
jgi:hypothetical protein